MEQGSGVSNRHQSPPLEKERGTQVVKKERGTQVVTPRTCECQRSSQCGQNPHLDYFMVPEWVG